jgi:hypothetical protein
MVNSLTIYQNIISSCRNIVTEWGITYGGDPFTGMDSSVKYNGGSLTPA